MVGLKFSLDTSQIDKALAGLGEEEILFVIYNDANNNGTYYFDYVNDGRGEVRPVNAKVLHWVQNGEEVFAMYAGPSAPRHIRENSMPAIRQGAKAFVKNVKVGMERKMLIDLVYGVAEVAVAELQKNTPGNGPLKKGYRIEKAK